MEQTPRPAHDALGGITSPRDDTITAPDPAPCPRGPAVGTTMLESCPPTRLCGHWRSFRWIASDDDITLNVLEPLVRSSAGIYLLGEP